MAWASGLSQCDGETALALCRRLPSWCLDEQVRKFNERRAGPEAGPSSGGKKFAAERGNNRSSLFMARDRAAERFEGFLKKRGIEFTSEMALPWGTWRKYLEANPDVAERLTTTRERAAHCLWCVRALRSRNLHGSLPDAKVRKKFTRDSGYGKGGAVWNISGAGAEACRGGRRKRLWCEASSSNGSACCATALPCASPRNS